jgi:hypothetical protein
MKNITIEYIKKVIQKWDAGQIAATDYYYKVARRALATIGDDLTSEERSSVIGIIEVYNMNQ